MSLRETPQKRADGSLVTHLQLAESTWNPHKKRSEVRIVSNCGRADAPQTAERLRKLPQSIRKKCAPHEIVEQDLQWRLLAPWPFGALDVLEAIWQRLGLPDIIAEPLAHRTVAFALARALCALGANRAGAPSATLSCYDQWRREGGRMAGTAPLA